jgi:hypothetical protein
MKEWAEETKRENIRCRQEFILSADRDVAVLQLDCYHM